MKRIKKETPLATQLRKSIELKERELATDNAPHLIVEARAGTGKTTTLICGLQILKGEEPHVDVFNSHTSCMDRKTITPSPQQAAIWESMKLSTSAKSVCFVAFNKSIATELQLRVPEGCDAMTMHSMGFKAVTKQYRCKVNSYRVQDIISELLETDIRELRRTKPILLKATEELVGLCKMNLTNPAVTYDPTNGCTNVAAMGEPLPILWAESLSRLTPHYNVDLNGTQADVFELVPRVLERCKDVAKDGAVDFDDMIWLPVVLNLPITKYDLLLVDECQDLNRCQQELAKRAGRRLVLVGDPKQAIYGFAGADSESMTRMHRELMDSSHFGRGVIILPLTVTRRCGKAIVKEANKYVSDFEAHETNPEGRILHMKFTSKKIDLANQSETLPMTASVADYSTQVQDGDMVLCRVNAPLVSQCFRFLKAGRKAGIQGRDVGQGLISTVKKLKAVDCMDLLVKIGDWLHKETTKEQAKRNPDEARLIALQDRADCLNCFCDGCDTVDEVVKKIESIFTDNKQAPGIRLSSIHKAKGLEAKRVFFLRPKGGECPHPMAKTPWQKEQELNLCYVAITRAIEEIVYVS